MWLYWCDYIVIILENWLVSWAPKVLCFTFSDLLLIDLSIIWVDSPCTLLCSIPFSPLFCKSRWTLPTAFCIRTAAKFGEENKEVKLLLLGKPLLVMLWRCCAVLSCLRLKIQIHELKDNYSFRSETFSGRRYISRIDVRILLDLEKKILFQTKARAFTRSLTMASVGKHCVAALLVAVLCTLLRDSKATTTVTYTLGFLAPSPDSVIPTSLANEWWVQSIVLRSSNSIEIVEIKLAILDAIDCVQLFLV